MLSSLSDVRAKFTERIDMMDPSLINVASKVERASRLAATVCCTTGSAVCCATVDQRSRLPSERLSRIKYTSDQQQACKVRHVVSHRKTGLLASPHLHQGSHTLISHVGAELVATAGCGPKAWFPVQACDLVLGVHLYQVTRCLAARHPHCRRFEDLTWSRPDWYQRGSHIRCSDRPAVRASAEAVVGVP